MTSTMGSKIKVAVIGAGAAGLCAARHLSDDLESFEFDVFEQQNEIGGTWIYTKEVGKNEFGLPIHSSMYENLRTNLPKEVMSFPGFPFPECEGKSFVHHTDVLQYLKNYAKCYNLYVYIKFHTLVTSVKPVNTLVQDPKWIVETRDLITKQETNDKYDAVMVCNGHYSVPYIPDLPGLEKFGGILLHSHEYRNNSVFKDLKVVILGAAASGIDIAIEVSKVANEVVLSHNLPPRTTVLPENLIQDVGIRDVQGSGVTFLNDHVYQCDAIILCTGYLYTYPFLHPECQVKVSDQRVRPLYKHLFHIEYPTFAIWSIPKQILPFPIYNQQVLVFLKCLRGEVVLPSREEMMEDANWDFRRRIERGMKERNAHTMTVDLQWDYDDQLSALGDIPPLPPAVRKLFAHIHALRKLDVLSYKEFNFKIVDEENFVEVM